MSGSAIAAVEELAGENGVAVDSVLKKVRLKTSTVEKMQRFYMLLADDPTNMPKEPEIISFMTEKAFDWFITSGEMEKRVAEIAKKG